MPIAPVSIALATPPVLEVDVAPARTELWMVVAAGGTLDVKGALVAEDAPLNAGTVLLGFGATEVLLGFNTPSITWMTPLETSTFGIMTLAELTKTDPSSIVIVKFAPLTVVSDVFDSSELYPTVPCTTW